MLISGIFYFLSDDSLFNEDMRSATPALRSNSEFIELTRDLRLLALQDLFRTISTLKRELEREKQWHREAQAREVWTINQFLKHVSPEQGQAVLIDRKVNDMDPDFSFVKAITCSEAA
jgi:hypothetical protein